MRKFLLLAVPLCLCACLSQGREDRDDVRSRAVIGHRGGGWIREGELGDYLANSASSVRSACGFRESAPAADAGPADPVGSTVTVDGARQANGECTPDAPECK